ncbi:hypothetical protein TEA_013274 [Camellia sinensis var. sinensis]|uniref:Peptidase M48 domain-containing protein n=1 Tax=Camellia sinensis var. sinensis TaxID=542762 RepID=A0A4S4D5T6_CAMSN|nr:hypothetical protein TEA_013274 [Camellia sinensis var. sinensis]
MHGEPPLVGEGKSISLFHSLGFQLIGARPRLVQDDVPHLRNGTGSKSLHLSADNSGLVLSLFSARMEMEADYIGLLLIASSGYDPRVAPNVYEKLGKVTGESALRDYLSTHPSGKKRAQLLAHAQVMEEAMAIYREVQSGRGIEGFL